METTLDNTQPRFRAYCILNGASSPEEMWKRDSAKYPGGPGFGFMSWVQSQWREWFAVKGYSKEPILGDEDHAEFSEWLLQRVKGA